MRLKLSMYRYLVLLGTVNLVVCSSCAIADGSQPELKNQEKQVLGNSETGIEIGPMVILGSDFRIFHRESGSPWIIGFRYLDIRDDFIIESEAGLPNDESDKEYTKRAGFYFHYLFNRIEDSSYFLSGAMYSSTKTIKCDSGSDSESYTNVYFGGGYRGRWSKHFGYKIGFLMSPFVNLKLDTSNCGSESNGDIDLDTSLIFLF